MKKLENIIVKKLLNNKNIILVWETNKWKSYFIENKVLPILKEKNINFSYFEDCERLVNNSSNIYLIDEVEVLFDKDFLEKNHPEENPYYTNKYIKKVRNWHTKLAQINSTMICIVTRNKQNERTYLVNNYKFLEWNKEPVEVIEF